MKKPTPATIRKALARARESEGFLSVSGHAPAIEAVKMQKKLDAHKPAIEVIDAAEKKRLGVSDE